LAYPVQIGWIDFNSRDRDKILSVLSLLSFPAAVDELGIGVVRDGFADLLFPGTSTIQTRAKYFLLVPYILMELEREKNLTPAVLLDRLAREELALIPVLSKDNAEGVIGARAGEKLQRKPSSIYWNGLYTYGIFRYPTRLSLNAYARAVWAIKREKSLLSSAGVDQADDSSSLSGGVGSFWYVTPPDKWRENLTIELTSEEAHFLRGRVIRSKHSKDSLLAFILKKNLSEVTTYDDISIIGKRIKLPQDIRSDYEMALRFSRFIYGANIRYNVILSSGQNETANEEWNCWYEAAVQGFIQNYDVYEPFDRLSISGRNRARILPFMRKWKQAVLTGDITEMDHLIISREIELKGRERAKLQNSKVYHWQEGTWLGGGRLQYRFSNVRTLLADIFNGLGLGGDTDV
jgi:hypothetical protein